jgi:hypothetical protein
MAEYEMRFLECVGGPRDGEQLPVRKSAELIYINSRSVPTGSALTDATSTTSWSGKASAELTNRQPVGTHSGRRP